MYQRCFLVTIICIVSLGTISDGFSAQSAQNEDNACQGGYSSQFILTGEVNNPTSYDGESLGRLPHSIENVTFFTKTGPQSASFSGVLLWNLLTAAGSKTDPARDGQFQYVEITATDCYQVILALAELDPSFGGEQVLVADGQNGSPLGADSGFARIIVPGDKFGGRDTFWVAKMKVLSGPPPRN